MFNTSLASCLHMISDPQTLLPAYLFFPFTMSKNHSPLSLSIQRNKKAGAKARPLKLTSCIDIVKYTTNVNLFIHKSGRIKSSDQSCTLPKPFIYKLFLILSKIFFKFFKKKFFTFKLSMKQTPREKRARQLTIHTHPQLPPVILCFSPPLFFLIFLFGRERKAE